MNSLPNSTQIKCLLLLIISVIVAASLQTYPQDVLYDESFDDGAADRWYLEPTWTVVERDTNYVLSGEGHSGAELEEGRRWRNYSFKFQLKLLQGTTHINFRISESRGWSRYLLGIHEEGFYLEKQTGDEFTQLTKGSTSHQLNEWLTIEIKVYEGYIQLFVNEKMEIDYLDDDPLFRGTVGFETLEDSKALIDEVKIFRLTTPLTKPKPRRICNQKVEGTVPRHDIWCGEIYVTDSIFIPEGSTLTIEPGTKIMIDQYRGYKNPEGRIVFDVEGKLEAVGTKSNPITFTSAAEEPINGDWEGIYFAYSDESIVKYTIIEFARQGISGYNSDVIVSHNVVRWNNWEGVYFENRSKPTIEYNRIYENGYQGIALEQYNEADISYNTITRNNECGLVVLGSTAHLDHNIISNNEEHGILLEQMAKAGGYIDGSTNAIYGNKVSQVLLGTGTTAKTNQLNKTCSRKCFTIDYDYTEKTDYELGYIPGDKNDRFMYIYPSEDETRKVVSKFGEEIEFPWSLTWDEKYIWAADLDGRALYKLDPDTGKILTRLSTPDFYRVWGLAWDGDSLWALDFEKRKIYQINPSLGLVISTISCPDTGGCRGLTYAKDHIFTIGVSTGNLYSIDPQTGKVDKEISFRGDPLGLTYDGEYFWAPCCGNLIGKFDEEGRLVGGIYTTSEGTWDLAWDGQYLWAAQRTNENWHDPKIYKIEIIDDSLVKK